MPIRSATSALFTASCLALGPLGVHAVTPTNPAVAQATGAAPAAADVSRTATDGTAATNAAAHPFTAIPTRNAFQIKPPPPPPVSEPEPPKAPPAPPPNVFLTGFSSWKGVKKVYLQVSRPGSKGPDYLDLRVGDQQFDIKVLEINEREEFARILNGDQEVVLNFRENGNKPSAAPSPGGQGIPSPANVPALTRGGPSAGGGGGPAYIGKGGMVQPAGGTAGIPAPNVVPGGEAAGVPGIVPAATADMRTLPARRASMSTSADQNPNLQTVAPNQVRVLNGRTLPPPPPLPVDPSTLPGN